MKRVWFFLACASLIGALGCAQSSKPASTLTERQRDSVLSRSGLPGAFVIRHAMDATDRATTRRADMDSLTH